MGVIADGAEADGANAGVEVGESTSTGTGVRSDGVRAANGVELGRVAGVGDAVDDGDVSATVPNGAVMVGVADGVSRTSGCAAVQATASKAAATTAPGR